MPNTRIDYLYRDTENNKTEGTLVLAGTVTPEQSALMFVDGEDNYFLPEQVGLSALQPVDLDESIDHIWHELTGVREVEDAPTRDDLTAAAFAEQFRGIEWDELAALASLVGYL